MSKNYITEVAKMLGVEIGEKFDVVDNGVINGLGPFRFTQMGLKDSISDSSIVLKKLLSGECTIRKIPWKPKYGEVYWFVCPDGDVYWRRLVEDNYADLALLNMENCFQNKEMSENARDGIIEKFEKIRKRVIDNE